MLPASADAVPDVWFAGTRLVFDRAQLRGADIAVATGDSGLRSLLGRTGANISYQPGQRYIVVTSADRRTITFTLGDTRVSGGGITTSAPFAPYTAGSDAYVPLVSLAHALYLLPVPDRGAIVLQPQLGALDVHTDNQTTVVTLHGATRLAFRRLTAGSDRLVLSFSGIASSLDPARVVSTPGLSQIDVAPSGSVRNPATTVSFTLPSSAQSVLQPSSSPNDLTLAFAPSGVALRGSEIPASGYGPVASMPPMQSSTAGSQTQVPVVSATPSATPAVINAVDIAPNAGDGADVHIAVSGGADFEWHRLNDGRWYVDIRGATLALPPRDDAPNVGGVTGLRVRQFALDPVPVVRVSLTLQSQRRVDIATTSGGLTVSVGANDDPLPAKVGVGQLGGGSGYATAAVQSSAPPDLGTQPLPAPGSNPRLIVLDPGHGGSDSGAEHNGVTEKNVTLDISRRLRGVLASRGWTVRMTRDSDVDVYAPNDSAHDELQARCDIANRAGARLFVSIHANSFTTSSLNGTTTYYYKSVDLALARAVHRRLIAALGTKDDGVRKENFYVIHHTTMPAILIETAFISNPSDAALMRSPEFLQRIAIAIADGVSDFSKLPQAAVQSGDEDGN
jgi:N-acetylmuramoyl-L-alanine amidase